MDLVYVADHARMRLVPVGRREPYASVAAGADERQLAEVMPAFPNNEAMPTLCPCRRSLHD